MAQHTIGAYAGNVSGYVGNGPEVRGDAGSPRPASTALSGQFRQPFAPPAGPLGDGSPLQLERPELPETPDEESPAPADSWRYNATVEAPGPSYGGAIYNDGGGQLANDMSGPGRPAISGAAPRAIESSEAKVIAGIAEDVL